MFLLKINTFALVLGVIADFEMSILRLAIKPSDTLLSATQPAKIYAVLPATHAKACIARTIINLQVDVL